MKTIILVRHAKSSWDDSSLKDFDRPLAARGIKDAPKMGVFLKEKGLFPDYVICSSARRTRMTLELICEHLDCYEDNIIYDKRIYTENAYGIMDIINTEVPDSVQRLMVVGHNPDMETLVYDLTGHSLPHPKFSTAGVAVITIDISSWSMVGDVMGDLQFFKSPKMLS